MIWLSLFLADRGFGPCGFGPTPKPFAATHEIRFDETVGRWDAGLGRTYYLTRPVVAGRLPDGRDAVLWASEWTNPRPDVPIVSVALVGSPGPSDARPILFGVTGVQKPRVEDYR